MARAMPRARLSGEVIDVMAMDVACVCSEFRRGLPAKVCRIGKKLPMQRAGILEIPYIN